MKFYGSVNNRLEENRMFCDEIKVGTGMTKYFWSDTHAYEVVEVADQKHIKVREYDHKKADDEPYSNNWQLISNPENPIIEMAKRGKYWYYVKTFTSDMLDDKNLRIGVLINGITEEQLRAKGTIKRYERARVSFGIARYYHDYEF